jgi:hypothetical protein
MKRYTVKAFTIQSKWLEYSTNDKAKAMKCASNVECARVFDNQPEGGGSPLLIHSKGEEVDVGKKYLLDNHPKASNLLEELLN